MDKIKLILRSHGLKRLQSPDSNHRLIPKADLYMDARSLPEKGIPGNSGDDPKFQAEVLKRANGTLEAMLNQILYSLARIEDRRSGDADPYAKPFVVCFLCAFGVHRSAAAKHIIGQKLKALDMNVKVEL